MAGLHFDITGDNSNFIRKLHECENGVRNTSKQIEQSGLSIEDLFNRMTKAAAAFGVTNQEDTVFERLKDKPEDFFEAIKEQGLTEE